MQLDRIPTLARSPARSQSNQHVWVLPAISRDEPPVKPMVGVQPTSPWKLGPRFGSALLTHLFAKTRFLSQLAQKGSTAV